MPVRSILILISLFVGLMIFNPSHVSQKTFQPQLIGIWTSNLETSVDWYVSNLGFEIEEKIKEYPAFNLKVAFLKKENFHLELLEKKPSFHSSEIFADENHNLGGIAKIGFLVENIEEKYEELQATGQVDFVTEIGSLPEPGFELKWPKRYFLIRDPDGNYIQFFSYDDASEAGAAPWLVMITTGDIEHSIAWYTGNLEFTHHHTMGNTGNRRAILSRNNFVLELFEPSITTHRESFSKDSTILGFDKLAFGVPDLSTLSASFLENEVSITMGPDSSVFPWATQTMATKDSDENLIQFFELDQ